MEILGVESSHPLVLFTAGSILEISTELCPDPTIPRMKDSSTREALETAWQSGMDASDTSSDSSLELENCSLDEFNTTCRYGTNRIGIRASCQKCETFSKMFSQMAFEIWVSLTTLPPENNCIVKITTCWVF